MVFVPETLPWVVISREVKKAGAASDEVEAIIAGAKVNVLNEIKFVITMAMRIMFTEPIVMFLGMCNVKDLVVINILAD